MRRLPEVLVLVKGLFGFAVELLQVADHGRGLAIEGILLAHVLQQHAELGAPVPHVVQAHHVVAQIVEEVGKGVPQDGGPQMPYVHLLKWVFLKTVVGLYWISSLPPRKKTF